MTTETKELHASILAAQMKLRNVGFDSDNPHFGNQYASLPAVRNAVVPAFHEQGMAVLQELRTGEKGPRLLTKVLHTNGTSMEASDITMPAGKETAQAWAGCVTYARRYSLLALGGITGDFDDDGEVASGRLPTKPLTKKA